IRFRGDGKAQPLALSHFFENRSRSAEFFLGRLVRIGGGANRDVLAPDFLTRKIALGERPGILLHINLRLEITAIQLHILVGISRITISAAELAASVWIHRPGERHSLRIAVV